MRTFILRRLLQSLVTLLLITLIIFFAVRFLPGDPIYLLVFQSDLSGMGDAEIEALRAEFGLDKPVIVQYFYWMLGVFRGDLGTSIFTNIPVSKEIFRRLPITFEMGIIAIILGAAVGIPLGILSAVKRGRWLDQLVTVITNIGICIPVFWFGLLLMLLFGVRLSWLPVMGFTAAKADFALHVKQLVMPVCCLFLYPMAAIARQTRSSMLEVLNQDYVRTARSKGLPERVVIFKHALRTGLIPVITTVGLSVPVTVGGATVVENVFNVPGMGRLLVTSVQAQDYAYVQGIILVIAVAILLTNLLIDLAYGWADPRIRYR